MSLEPGGYFENFQIQQNVLRRKYQGVMVDGYLPLHEYYQELGSMASFVPIVEPSNYRGKDRSVLEADASANRMSLELTVRASMDETALEPRMVLRTPSLQRDIVASIMSQAEEAMRRK
jgi:hypothetical protein